MSVLDVTYPAWMDSAACRDGDPSDFFPEKGGTAERARAVCRECPVRQACLQWAVDTGEEHGVYGGMVPGDRRRIPPTSAIWQCPKCLDAFRTQKGMLMHKRDWCGVPQSHNTHGAYSAGCRCDPCKSAHAAYMRTQRRRAAKVAAA
jgi:hypothetical protein